MAAIECGSFIRTRVAGPLNLSFLVAYVTAVGSGHEKSANTCQLLQ